MSTPQQSAKSRAKNSLKFCRDWLAARFGHRASPGRSKLWIVTYHRVLPHDDPRAAIEEPGMIITPETLEKQLQWAKKRFTIVSLQDWLETAERGGELPERACAITFDDGWKDNYEFALPILKRCEVPATLFTVSHMLDKPSSFWPNRVAALLSTKPTEELKSVDWLAAHLSQHESLAERISNTVASLKTHPDEQINAWLDNSEKKSAEHCSAEPSALLDWHELKQMANSGVVEIGSHTCHHVRLNEKTDINSMTREVIDSKARLEQELDRPVPLFCYPNGDYEDRALALVKQHYQAAVTTERGVNEASSLDLHRLKRFSLHEDASNTETKFLARLASWA